MTAIAVRHMLAGLLFEAAVGGHMLCAEGRGLVATPDGRDELAAIAQVAIHRARLSGRAVVDELAAPGQFSLACPDSAAARALAWFYLSVRLGFVKAPAWSRGAVGFVARWALNRVNTRWRARGLRPLASGGASAHVFWEG